MPTVTMRSVPFVMLPMRESRLAPTKRPPLTSFTNGAKEADSLTATAHGLVLGAVYVRTACVAVVPTKLTEDGSAIVAAIVLATVKQIAVVLRVTKPTTAATSEASDVMNISSLTPRQEPDRIVTILSQQKSYSTQDSTLDEGSEMHEATKSGRELGLRLASEQLAKA